MLIDLLSMSNYEHYNVKLAQVLGLHAAIYLNQIMSINEKAIRKGKTQKNYFTIDRAYITSRTTLPEKEQLEIETNLIKIGVLKRSKAEDNTLQLDVSTLTSMLMTPDEDLLKDVSKIVKKKTQSKDNKQSVIDNLRGNIVTINPELRQSYFDWIDSVFEKDGGMSKAAVVCAQRNIDEFSNHNLDIALKILEIATVNRYRDVTWAIRQYQENYQVTYNISTPKQQETHHDFNSAPPVRKRLGNTIF